VLTVMGQAMANMGQTLFDPPNVAGWPGDKLSTAWMSTQVWITRVNFINLLLEAATGALRNRGVAATSTSASALQAIMTAQRIGKPDDLINYFIALLLDNQVASDRTAVLRGALTSATSATGATGATSATSAGPTLSLVGGGTLSTAAAREALYLLMSMPEYQMN